MNAANGCPEHGGGVAYAIARAAAGNVTEYVRISKEVMRKTAREKLNRARKL